MEGNTGGEGEEEEEEKEGWGGGRRFGPYRWHTAPMDITPKITKAIHERGVDVDHP